MIITLQDRYPRTRYGTITGPSGSLISALASNQVAPAPVADQPTVQEYNPTYNPEYNPNQLPDDSCWSAECLDMPKPTGQRAYCPICQSGFHGR